MLSDVCCAGQDFGKVPFSFLLTLFFFFSNCSCFFVFSIILLCSFRSQCNCSTWYGSP